VVKRISKTTVLSSELEDVRRIRGRYAQALQAGYTTVEAAKIANGDQPIEPRRDALTHEPQKSSETPSASYASAVTPTDVAIINGSAATPQAKTEFEIPPNWRDLPWAQLKSLAESLTDMTPTSRKTAGDMIENALAGRQ
jgi:hypothetical protein